MTIVHLIKLLDPSIWSQHVLGVPSCLKAVFKGSKCCFWQDHRRQMQSFTVSSRETIFQQKPMGFLRTGSRGKNDIPPGSLTYPLKNYHPKRKGLLQPSFFRGYVKLQGCIHGRKQKTSNWVFLFGRALMPLFTRECKHNKRKACRFGIRSEAAQNRRKWRVGRFFQWLRWLKFAGYVWKQKISSTSTFMNFGTCKPFLLIFPDFELPSYPGYDTPNSSCMGI